MDEISLIIKAPNQKYEDLKINCDLSWTILDLKMHLFKEYPSNPAISDQRLIYSGHLLKDEQCLHDVIQSPVESTYTFHLVCPQKQTSKPDQPKKSSESSNLNQDLPTEPTNAFQTLSGNISNPSSSSSENPMLSHFGSGNSTVMQESYNTMMNQYYQYMSYVYLSSPPITDYASYYAFANAYMNGTNVNHLTPPTLNENVNNANGANEDRPNVAANNRNANNNANNNQADNEEANRDWTDLLYSFSKAMVMLSIMYFYSSFGRLLLLITIALALYLYKNARLAGVQNILNNNNNNQQDNGPEQPQMEQANNNEANNNQVPQSEQPQDPPNDADNTSTTNDTNETRENLPYSGLRLVWVFVSSLFTSLIPDPTPIN